MIVAPLVSRHLSTIQQVMSIKPAVHIIINIDDILKDRTTYYGSYI